VLNDSGVRQTEVHTAELLVPGPSHYEVEIVIAKMERYKSPGSDQTSQNYFMWKVKHCACSPQSLIPFGIRKHCLISTSSQKR
jgi:hypothetical protein